MELITGRKHTNAMTVKSLEGVKDASSLEENVNGDLFEDLVKTTFLLILFDAFQRNSHSVVITKLLH